MLIAVGRLEGRVEQFLHHQARQDDRLNNHGDRLSTLERSFSRILGWAAGVSAAVAAVAAAVSLALQHIKISIGG